MNLTLMLRYAVELAIIIPAAFLAVIPVTLFQKVNTKYLVFLFSTVLFISVIGGAAVCTIYHLSSNTALLIFSPILFLAYHFCYDLSWQKKLFCFLNASMLCGFCTMYSTFVTAPLELDNHDDVFRISSGLICLGITLAVGGTFFRTLYKKLPALLQNESLNKLWSRLILVPLFMTAAVIWMTPLSPSNAMVGRLRTVSMVVLLLIPVTAWFFYHILWWTAERMSENARLQQSNDILRMEEKQYRHLRSYMEETSTLRHDFRHHLLTIEELAKQGNTEKLLEYIQPFIEKTSIGTHRKHFENPMLDAVAAHYIDMAQSQNTRLLWNIDLPEKFPFKESDICAMLGNLLENSLKAVKDLPEFRREIKVAVLINNDTVMIVHITNPYKGNIFLDENDLPIIKGDNHGIGLRSVLNTVEHYNGYMSINTKNNIFEVSIMINAD